MPLVTAKERIVLFSQPIIALATIVASAAPGAVRLNLLLTQVPEPGAMALFGMGVGALGIYLGRRPKT